MNKTLIVLIILISLFSCSKAIPTEHKLPPAAYAVNPYQKNVSLIFATESNQVDTIFINGITKAMVRGGDPFSVNPDRFENYRINYTTPASDAEKGLVYVGYFGGDYKLRFELELGHSRLFCLCDYSNTEFDDLPETKLTTNNNTYTDVKTLYSDPYYTDRNNRVDSLYWSTSSGLLGWDTPEAAWRLKKVILDTETKKSIGDSTLL